MDTATINGKRYVLLPEAEYRRLTKAISGDKQGGTRSAPTSLAPTSLPPLPPLGPDGCYPALELANATIARSIVRRRKATGLTQTALAEAAGIRVEVLNRAERGAVVPSARTLTKLEVALSAAEGARASSAGRVGARHRGRSADKGAAA